MLRPLLLLVVILLVTVIQHASAWEPPMALCVLGFMAVTMVDIIIIHAQRKDLNALEEPTFDVTGAREFSSMDVPLEPDRHPSGTPSFTIMEPSSSKSDVKMVCQSVPASEVPECKPPVGLALENEPTPSSPSLPVDHPIGLSEPSSVAEPLVPPGPKASIPVGPKLESKTIDEMCTDADYYGMAWSNESCPIRPIEAHGYIQVMLKDQWYDAQNEKHEEDTLWLYELWREWKVVAGPWGLKVMASVDQLVSLMTATTVTRHVAAHWTDIVMCATAFIAGMLCLAAINKCKERRHVEEPVAGPPEEPNGDAGGERIQPPEELQNDDAPDRGPPAGDEEGAEHEGEVEGQAPRLVEGPDEDAGRDMPAPEQHEDVIVDGGPLGENEGPADLPQQEQPRPIAGDHHRRTGSKEGFLIRGLALNRRFNK